MKPTAGLDLSDLSIEDALTTASGVALVRIKELEKILRERDAEIQRMDKQLFRMEERMDKSKSARLVWEAERKAEHMQHINNSMRETIQSLVAERKALKAMAKLQEIQNQ